ncbi:hypothetical protein HDV00_006796 [Rhizophlyctis rosea]|nr:hypothetical protein HDV00_006796 [Rhizophlyctis rosea]
MQQWRAQILVTKFAEASIAKKFPKHVGVIMDGNRRFAKRTKSAPITEHVSGATGASNIIMWWLKYAHHTQIRHLTLWAFSDDNFSRPEDEILGLFELMESEFRTVRLNAALHLFKVRRMERATEKYDNFYLQVAVGYGGRSEVTNAVHEALRNAYTAGNHIPLEQLVASIDSTSISANTFGARLGIPPVDDILRTSGEIRTSGFMLWDSQYAELYVIDKLWPELTEIDYLEALKSYLERHLRKGRR